MAVADAASRAMLLLVVITEKVPAGIAPPKVQDPTPSSRLYEPGARFAVATVQVNVSITAAEEQEAAEPAVLEQEAVDAAAVVPTSSLAVEAVAMYPAVNENTILPVSFGRAVDVVKPRVKVPAVEVTPGTLSAGTEKVAEPVPLAVPPVVIAGTLPEAMVSTITFLALTRATVYTV